MSRICAISLLAAVLAVGPVAAEEGAEPSATVVVFDGDDGLERTTEAWVQQRGHDAGVRFVPVTDVFAMEEPVVLLGEARLRGCEGELIGPEKLDELTGAVVHDVAMMEYLSATATLGEIDRQLPCLARAPDPNSLGGYHFLRGIVAYYADGHEDAVDRFEEGLLVSPFLQWNAGYPPAVKPAFMEALSSALAAGTAFLSVSARITEEGELWLDGLQVDPRMRTTTLNEGTHLVQWMPTGGVMKSWVATVEEGQSLELVDRDDAVEDLLAGRAGPGLTAYAASRVLAPVELEAGAQLRVAQPWDVVLFHEFDAAAGRWWLADMAALEAWRTGGKRMRTGGVGLVIAGVTTAVLGAGIAIDGADTAKFVRQGIFGQDGLGDPVTFQQNASFYSQAAQQATAGTGIAFAGGALTVGGIPLIAIGHARTKATGLRKGVRKQRRTRAGEVTDEVSSPFP